MALEAMTAACCNCG